ncbi:fimbrial protein [Scandinavium sp. H11S7]|uniref:fimbrial protein n=1 Tax=Scandinavium hiltneri TaxID=2926519 RepID=UPI002166BF01|nr:fimbrial protein [Scandinavium hiltneri]MCS2159042.1 fimbrial protein [Scandinavium hiltneri]
MKTAKLLFSLAKIIAFLGVMSVSVPAMANGNCTNTNGPNQITINTGNRQITDPANNTAGYVMDQAYSWGGYDTTFSCACSTDGNWVLTSIMLLPDAGGGWYTYNDYLDIKLTITKIGGSVSRDIPFENLVATSMACYSGAKTWPNASGTHGYLSLRIRKSMVGVINLPQMKVAAIYACLANDGLCDASTPPTAEYYFTGTVTVPQNCVIHAGTQLSVPLGDFYSSDFKTVGQKPDNYTPKAFTVPITCNDMSATANLTLRIEGNASVDVPDALQSDNSDVGVIVTDEGGHSLVPNDMTSKIPFQLDANYSSNITLHAYPVGTTGKTPAVGTFTTLAYLRIDFA